MKSERQEQTLLSALSIFHPSSVHLVHSSLCQAPRGPSGPLAALWLLTTCCRQIVLSPLVHYCTSSCFSQHIKCIKAQWNSATNKDSTTADRVDGWSAAREGFDLCAHVCVHVEHSRHKAQSGGDKQHVTQSGTRQTCPMKLLSTEGFDPTLI